MKTILIILVLAMCGHSQNIDSLWAAIRQDSITAAATSHVLQIEDSRPAPAAEPQPEPPSERDRDLADSISAIVDRDSILELSAAMVVFKKQLQLKKFQLSTRLECLEFLLANKCRTKAQATAYLVVLKRYCDDRQAMYYAARRIVPDNQKHLAVAYMHKAQVDCGRVQVMIERLEK
jgi:hypothetical protein